uniref:Ras and Rab interactor 2 n=1 Tax=Balaenoptera musculus TaxID=9771 RepID=A0A8C0DEK6_BALMU
MSAWTMGACGLEKRGSFFKLIDTIASEIGELKQEMVQTDVSLENGLGPTEAHSMVRHKDDGYSEEKDVKTCPRDSGYDSLSNRLSVLDRLLHTHPIWLQLGLSEDEAAGVLRAQPPGIFLVRKSTKMQKKVLSLRLPCEFGAPLKEFAIKESTYNFWSSPADNKPPNPPPPHRPLSSDGVGPASRQLCLINGVHSIKTRTPSELECSQTNGALCFINPLFFKVHSQEIGGGPKRPCTRTPPDANGTERPRSPPPRPPPPAINSVHGSPQLSGPAAPASMPETVAHHQHGDGARLGAKPTPVPPPRLKKQASFLEAEGGAKTLIGGRPRPEPAAGPAGGAGGAPAAAVEEEEAPRDCTRARPAAAPASPSRAPWRGGRQRLSDMSISTSSSDSLDLDRSMPLFGYEADTNSSLEDYDVESDQETMAPPIKSKKKRNSSFVLPKLVKSQLRKMSGVFSSFLTPEKRMVRRIAELARDKRTYFGCLVQDYVSFLQENKECHVSSTDLLQTVRQFMTQVKNYLSQSSELDPPIESLIPEDQIDVVLEKAMHKCILKPLKGHVEAMLKHFHVADGSWKQLKENLQLVRQRNPQELGVFAPTPDFVDVEKIKVKFMTMQKMYSPEKKVMLLLRVCKLIYTVMENNSGRMYGADDFLPVLTYVIAQCDMLELDTEIEYMMELLDPSLLHGEGGYYLTSAYGALSLIKNFQEEQAARLLSSEARDTLRQWHKRRTTNRTIPSVDDFQNYLRVAFQDVNSGCTGKTLLVRPYVTTEDVCQLCAEKFKVADPEEYSLFLFVDETWQQLAEDTYPQKIKAELHSRPQSHVFHFVYKRIKKDPYGVIFQNGEEELTAS